MPELTNCPSCSRQLRVPESLIGKAVKCPSCGATFTAQVGSAGPPDPPAAPWQEPESRPEPRPRERPPERAGFEQEDEYERERPRRRIRRDVEPHRGSLILTFGILSLVVCAPVFGPIAWIMGNTDMEKIRTGRMDREGEGTTNAGRICGIIGTILGIIQVLCSLGYILIFVIAMAGAAAVKPGPAPGPNPGPGPRRNFDLPVGPPLSYHLPLGASPAVS